MKLKLHPEARAVFTTFYKAYPPIDSAKDAKFFSCTQGVFERMQLLYKPCRYYTVFDVERFLKTAGYKLDLMGTSDYKCWLLG